MKKNKHTGDSFDNFLKEEDLYEEVTARALKKTSIHELVQIVSSTRGLKSRIREALNDSPSMVERVLSDNPHVEFETLVRAGLSVGYAPVINWVPVEKLKKA
ncbi:MAG: Fis family transcriptional regulator [Bacteriovoracaceae bacterium]